MQRTLKDAKKINDVITETLETTPHVIVNNLGDILKERGLSQGDLSRLTGLRVATINDFINMKKTNANFTHLVPIMIALRISDMTEIIRVEFPDEVKKRFEKDMDGYTGGLTRKMEKEVMKNAEKMYVQKV
ncbi:XRE family transcriptional regulator [Bacillus pseudomycoides]|uniref:XRE family transcriptional regulator n=1 Tax=Bacillus pseudomycoides TaxID=64104 RepID=A0A2A8BYF3_9BACI|nr:helix-turn-helix transcriptional regulator [Bacillus pseudomycoides]PEM65296.1 XRE family transcriptional regulator [Bacillus pseudomycoides]